MIKFKPDKTELKKFGIAFAIFILIFFGLILQYIFKKNVEYYYWLIPSALFLVSGLILPVLLKPFFIVWMTVTHYIGRVNTVIILSLIYFVLITPFAFVIKLIRKDFMNSSFNKDTNSYRITSVKLDKDKMEKPY